METILEVKGMHCKGCEMTISKALMRVPGVNGAKVDYSSERAVVQHDEKLDAADVIAVIKEAGYDVGPARAKAERKRFLGLF